MANDSNESFTRHNSPYCHFPKSSTNLYPRPQQQGQGIVADNIVSEKTEFPEASEKALSTTPDGEEPNAEETATLRHVAEHLPISAWLVAIVELCERFTYYGMSGMFQNYVDRPLDGSEGRGALGMGHQGATGLTTFFQFWCYGSFITSCALGLTC